MARRPHHAPPTRDTGPRVNDRIRAPEVRLIGPNGENVGVVTPDRGAPVRDEGGSEVASAL
ncbi:MAG: translation initiation factor IF-3, partial [Pseudomonadota bacterium]